MAVLDMLFCVSLLFVYTYEDMMLLRRVKSQDKKMLDNLRSKLMEDNMDYDDKPTPGHTSSDEHPPPDDVTQLEDHSELTEEVRVSSQEFPAPLRPRVQYAPVFPNKRLKRKRISSEVIGPTRGQTKEPTKSSLRQNRGFKLDLNSDESKQSQISNSDKLKQLSNKHLEPILDIFPSQNSETSVRAFAENTKDVTSAQSSPSNNVNKQKLAPDSQFRATENEHGIANKKIEPKDQGNDSPDQFNHNLLPCPPGQASICQNIQQIQNSMSNQNREPIRPALPHLNPGRLLNHQIIKSPFRASHELHSKNTMSDNQDISSRNAAFNLNQEDQNINPQNSATNLQEHQRQSNLKQDQSYQHDKNGEHELFEPRNSQSQMSAEHGDLDKSSSVRLGHNPYHSDEAPALPAQYRAYRYKPTTRSTTPTTRMTFPMRTLPGDEPDGKTSQERAKKSRFKLKRRDEPEESTARTFKGFKMLDGMEALSEQSGEKWEHELSDRMEKLEHTTPPEEITEQTEDPDARLAKAVVKAQARIGPREFPMVIKEGDANNKDHREEYLRLKYTFGVL